MKNTQKKLKAKHFRYLRKEYVKNPDRFLREIVHLWDLNWANNFNYLINSSIYPPMRNTHSFEYSFIHIHLGQMLEVAFLILKKCRLTPSTKEELFQHCCKETFKAEIDDNLVFPKKALCDIFGFKTLRDWHKVLEYLLLSRDITEAKRDETYFSLDYIAIRELLVKLPKALKEIYNRGGLQYCLPDKTD